MQQNQPDPPLLQTLEATGVRPPQLTNTQIEVLSDLSPGEVNTLVLIGEQLDLTPDPNDSPQDFAGPLIF